jgi:hypothetical protein
MLCDASGDQPSSPAATCPGGVRATTPKGTDKPQIAEAEKPPGELTPSHRQTRITTGSMKVYRPRYPWSCIMKRTVPDGGALGGNYKLPLSARNFYLFSRYAWASTKIASIWGEPVVALWLVELWENEGAACDTIDWAIFRKKSLTILVHPGEAEYDFALRAGNKASSAGAFVFWRALPKKLITAIDQLDREKAAFGKPSAKELVAWAPQSKFVGAGAAEKSDAL